MNDLSVASAETGTGGVLVTGAGGALGSVLVRVLREMHAPVSGFVSLQGPAPELGPQVQLARVDLTDPRTYQQAVKSLAPRVIIHAAAIAKPAQALREPELARAVNVDATASLTELSHALGARFIYISTDMVFDGESAPYRETSATEPGTYYGRTKLEAECHVLTHPQNLVVRLPLLYGLPEVAREPGFFEQMLRALETDQPLHLFEDEVRTPLWLEDAARACSRLAFSELTGVIHVAGPERLSRLAMGQKLAAAIGCKHAKLVATQRAQYPSSEARPHDLSLDTTRYYTHFGMPAGLAMDIALPLVLARSPRRFLS